MRPKTRRVGNHQNNPAVGYDSTSLAELVKNLPMKLQLGIVKHMHTFVRAIEEGYLVPTADGHLQWKLEGATMLTYFCGRVWCGDYSRWSHTMGGAVWLQGKSSFPDAALGRLFGQKALRQIRLKRRMALLPELFELVDNLFIE